MRYAWPAAWQSSPTSREHRTAPKRPSNPLQSLPLAGKDILYSSAGKDTLFAHLLYVLYILYLCEHTCFGWNYLADMLNFWTLSIEKDSHPSKSDVNQRNDLLSVTRPIKDWMLFQYKRDIDNVLKFVEILKCDLFGISNLNGCRASHFQRSVHFGLRKTVDLVFVRLVSCHFLCHRDRFLWEIMLSICILWVLIVSLESYTYLGQTGNWCF